ncbi:MAG: ComEC/Rec2 family competence protein [Sedimentitalea sp.]
MRAVGWVDDMVLAQRGHLFPWVPICLALGIGIYFQMLREPGLQLYGGLGAGIICVALLAWRWPGGWAALGWALAMVAVGFCLAGGRANSVGDPVLSWRYNGAVEGRIVGLDRSASDAVRVTLDQVQLERVGPAKRPGRVRISLHGPPADLRPGQHIMTTAHLSPLQGPTEPGGFDFRRHAWFQGIGAVGYTRGPVLTVAPPDLHEGLRIFAIRMAMSAHIRDALGGDIGGFAAAVTTGDRSGISQTALGDLRASNLAHLLAISGLHMGLLAGFVFASLRVALSLWPAFALRYPVKKLAALGALMAATVYLGLSGGNVATERAFVMAAVLLIAVLLNRRAFSLRAVAIAALVVLSLRPEALMGPGFQMSFAATTALVAVFGWVRDADLPRAPGWAKPVIGVLMSSAIAGLATAPVGAAHFNTVSHYGLIANLVSVPLMGVLVIPAAVVALLLAPFGLESIGLWAMGLGLRWILWVAETVAGWDGAQSHVMAPGAAVLPMLALGALWVMLWQGRARWAGLAPAVLAFGLWAGGERPQVLVADTGGLVGVMTAEGRAMSKPKGAGFIARNWLENDGDAGVQSEAATRWPGPPGKVQMFDLGTAQIVHVIGKRAAAGFEKCYENQIVIVSVPLALTGPCTIYDPERLRQTGSLAIVDGTVTTARALSGARLWNTRAARQ